jgi:hypothetical protein
LAERAERALARSLGVPRSKVEVEPVGDRFHITTPQWGAACGLGPDARTPRGFPFSAAGAQLADCKVDPDCDDLFGMDCGQGDMALVVSVHGSQSQKQREQARADELEARGWKVLRGSDNGTTVLTATKGKRVKAVAVLASSDDGAVELLVAPSK